MRKKRKKMLWVILLLGIAVLVGWIAWGNRTIGCTEIQVRSAHLPEAFSGYTIAQVSDLHNAEFGADNERLLEALRQAAPDLIALTGDLVDSRRTDLDCAIAFVQAAVEIAPVYYVTGNHESRIAAYPELDTPWNRRECMSCGMRRNRSSGMVPFSLYQVWTIRPFLPQTSSSYRQLQSLLPTDDTFTLLLSHRPEPVWDLCRLRRGSDAERPCPRRQFRLPGHWRPVCPGPGDFPGL